MKSKYEFVYFCDQDRLNLQPYLDEIRSALYRYRLVSWDRSGIKREIPRAVLRNLLGLHDDYTALVNTGRILFPPEPSYTIDWETVDPTPEKPNA